MSKLGHLSKALQKYYTRKGNRIIFANGMTLNQLAWEMWERLGYREIDPSVLSRVISGERRFTHTQLMVFSKILKLGKSETSILREILAKELISKFDFDREIFSYTNEDYIDLLREVVTKIGLIRANDLPLLALEWIDTTEERIKSSFKKGRNARFRKELLLLLAQLLIEIGVTLN